MRRHKQIVELHNRTPSRSNHSECNARHSLRITESDRYQMSLLFFSSNVLNCKLNSSSLSGTLSMLSELPMTLLSPRIGLNRFGWANGKSALFHLRIRFARLVQPIQLENQGLLPLVQLSVRIRFKSETGMLNRFNWWNGKSGSTAPLVQLSVQTRSKSETGMLNRFGWGNAKQARHLP